MINDRLSRPLNNYNRVISSCLYNSSCFSCVNSDKTTYKEIYTYTNNKITENKITENKTENKKGKED